MRPRRDVPQDGVRRNEQIRAREVRVIGPEGEQVGILPCSDAIAMAHEAGYDLVEVAANAEPPVCRIMDYGKFKYDQAIKAKQARKNQSKVETKQMKFRPKIDIGDYYADDSRLRSLLGWEPRTELRDGLRHIVGYYRPRLQDYL